jgi:hypothetical protein
MKIYKVEMDLSLVISRLKKFELHEYNSERPIIFVEAKSPDDACHQAYYRLATVILKQDCNKKTASFIEEVLLDISITKVDIPK